MSQDLNDIEWTSLARYLAGEGSAAEVEHWMSVDPERSVWVGQLRHVFEARQRISDHWDIEEELRRFRARVKAHTKTEHAVFTGRKASGTQPWRWALWFTAAVVLGSAVVLVGWNAGMHPLGRHSLPSMVTYTTGNGERATITLPDGGTVALNVASRLDVPLDYMAGNHTVRLVGEGLFTVPHHEGAPFIVMAGGTAARVLGTSFIVRRYATDTATLVAVSDGKVAVGSTVVTAHHLLEIGQNSTAHMRSSDTSLFTFAIGVLTLNNLLLPAAIVELDRWYGADIRLGSPTFATKHLEGKFVAGSLGDLAQILESTYGVHVVRDGRVLTLYPRR